MKHRLRERLKSIIWNTYTYGSTYISALGELLADKDFGIMYKYIPTFKQVTMPYAERSRRYDKVIESILDDMDEGLKESILIKAPYGESVLCALLLFRTDKCLRAEYTVHGKRGADDLRLGDGVYTCRHRVPIVGLYEKAFNRVTMRLYDEDDICIEKKTIIIHTTDVRRLYDTRMTLTVDKVKSAEPFLVVTGGYHGATYIIDDRLNIRGFLTRRPQYYGIYNIDCGHFLFPELFIKRPANGVPHTIIQHEYDWMGRCYASYYDLYGYHHAATYIPSTGNILILGCSFTDKYMENQIVELDRRTGMVVRTLSMNDLFDETYVTRFDWVHINSIVYIEDDDSVVVSMRNIHTIAKISLKNRSIDWILAHPDFYKDTEQKDLVLTPKGSISTWFFQQHAADILPPKDEDKPYERRIILFDNHNAKRRPVKWYDGVKSSYVMIFVVDEKNLTVRQEKTYITEYTTTRANAVYNVHEDRVFAMDARLIPQVDGYQAKIQEMDGKSGALLREIGFGSDFFAAYPFEFDIKGMSEPFDDIGTYAKGELYQPELYDIDRDKLDNALVIPDDMIKSEDIRYRLYGDILMIFGRDQNMDEIVLSSDSVIYRMDFTGLTQPIKVFKDNIYWHIMPLDTLPCGKYHIYLHYDGIYYDTEQEISKCE